MVEKNKTALGVSSLVLGIIAICSSLFYYISLPTGILAIIFGAKSMQKTESKMGKSGLVTGIIGICLCVFLYVSMIIILIITNR